ncbi:hypothetical protein ACFL1T_02620 [Chlamydiota bacterium]
MKKYILAAIIIIILVFLLFRLSLILLLPAEKLVTLTQDDAFYYMNVALNIAQGNGVTFDGINQTNGFHPLWQITLIPLYLIIPIDRLLALRFVLIIQLAVYSTTFLLLLVLIAKRYSVYSIFPTIITFLFSSYINSLIGGLEAPLQLLILTVTIIFLIKYWFNETTIRKDILLGLLIGLLILSRLDSIVFLFSFLFFLFLQTIFRKISFSYFIKHSSIVSISSFLVIFPFLLWNKINFGHISTISSYLKSSFPKILFNPRIIIQYPQWSIFIVITILFLIIILAGKFFQSCRNVIREMSSSYQKTVIIFCIYVLIHFFFILLFSRWELAGWYFVPYLLIVPLGLSPIIAAIKTTLDSSLLKKTVAFLYMIFILLGFSFDIFMQGFSLQHRLGGNGFYEPSYHSAIWVKNNTPKGAIFATTDCGIFGYFSERSVIELDGVANNFEYQEWFLKKGLNNYLNTKKVTYIRDYASSTPLNYESKTLSIRSKIKRDFCDSISLTKKDEIYRSPSFFHLGKNKEQMIWKY